MEKNVHVYTDIRKVVYGLPQAGRIANCFLTKSMAPNVYYQCRHTPGLWRHKWRPVTFSLIVDEFGVKYVGKKQAEHLITYIQK